MTSPLPPASAEPERLLAVACPTCFGAVAVGAEFFGLAADCPLCGEGFRVPAMPSDVMTSPVAAPTTPTITAPKASAATATAPTATARLAATPTATAPKPLAPTATVLGGVAAEPAMSAVATPPPEPPTAQDELAPMRFREPVMTVGTGDGVIELRRLSPEEKAARRGRRNLIMLLTGVSILLAIVLILGRAR